MKKTKRILALVGAILLVAMYVSTLVFALTNHADAQAWFRGSIACTIFVPVLLFAINLVYQHTKPKKSKSIDNIVFDVGNVLVDFDWKGYMVTLGFDDEVINDLSNTLMSDPLWNEFDRNTRPYDDIVEEFCQKYPAHAAEMRTFTHSVEKTIHCLPFTHTWLQDLKRKGYKLYILSNWSQQTYERSSEELSFEQYMDGAIWSFKVKTIKPEKEIYEKLIDTYHLDPSRTVYLDDRQENLDGAKPFGFQTLLVTDHKTTLAKLAAVDVK